MNTQGFVQGDRAEATSVQVELSASPAPEREGERLRHILLGSPAAVRQTIHLLHRLRYIETVQWSPLIDIPNNRLVITAKPGEVMSLLTRQIQ